ncbi:Plasmodium exported protein (PHIST), unknown function [Plasmodium vivax]|uniref:Plasmodium RESA N-terminal domain-containing protein n=1 Tax=Plasmodium vivax TaxID=5855 RepID=A0A564ZWA4_PLAVI|nr:Plasmodium exported protein (PHIST), unknown function [Plasmodium vivax]
MKLHKMNSFSLLSGKKLSNLNKKNGGENVDNLSSNGEKINANGNFLGHFFSRRSVIAIGAILCVILQNTCTFENTTNSQLGLTAIFPRNLLGEGEYVGDKETKATLATLDKLMKDPAVTSRVLSKVKKDDTKKDTVNGKKVDMEELRERCQDNLKELQEDEIDTMLCYLTKPGCFYKVDALATWWQVRKRDKKEWENFCVQLSRLCKDTANKNNYNVKLSDKLLNEAQDDYTKRAKATESNANDKVYGLLNNKEKSAKEYVTSVNSYKEEQQKLRDQCWDEWEKKFNEEMTGKPFVKVESTKPDETKKGEAPKKAAAPKKGAAPKKAAAPKKPAAPKKAAAPKKPAAPKKAAAAKK